MAVATHTKPLEHETAVTGILRGGGDDTLGEERQSLRGLERRTWGILAHDTAVEERFPHIHTQQTMVLGALTTHHHTGIVRGRRHHTEHLTR